MKLHRIQVTNLNSLYGEQGVDLESDLQGAGLFLIQGPTGSGKSTLMDAVSLALFGTTPRLSGLRSEAAVAEQIMSRGAGTAQAVVELSKWEPSRGERVRYRATWAARRARSRPEGNMQATSRGLDRLEADGTWTLLVSDHRAKVYQPVFDAVLEGFTAQDFQRSMLLAQGQFDAMLHAPPAERAAILERLTDTAVYQELGEKAARMRGAWEGRLARLRAVVEGISPVAPEAVELAREQVGQQRAALAALDAQVKRHQAWRAWLVQQASLEGDATAQVALVEALVARELQAQDDLAALAEHERCALALGLLAQRDQAGARVARLDRERKVLVERLPGLEEQLRQAATAQQGAQRRAQLSAQALEALREPVHATSTAAAELATAQSEQAKAVALRDRSRLELDGERERSEQLEAALARAVEAHGAAVRALRKLDGDAPLAEALPELEASGARLAEAWSTWNQEHESLAQLDAELEHRRAGLDLQAEQLEARRTQRIAPLEVALARAGRDLEALLGAREPLAALAEHRAAVDAAALRAQQLELALSAARGVDQAQGVLGARALTLQERGGELEEAGALVERGQGELASLAAAVEKAQAIVEPLARIASLESQREQLEAGLACPLCGSEEHPWVQDPQQAPQSAALHAELEAARAAFDDARGRHESARDALARQREAVAGARARLEAAQVEHRQASVALEQARAGLAPRLVALELPPDTGLEALQASLNAASEQQAQAQAQLRALEGAREAHRLAGEALEAAQDELAEAADALAQGRAGLAEALAGRDGRRGSLRARERKLEERRLALAAALAPFGIAEQPAEAGLPVAKARVRVRAEALEAERQAGVEQQAATKDLQACKLAVARLAKALERAAAQQGERGAAVQGAQAALELARASLMEAWKAALAGDSGTVERPAPDAAPATLLASQQARVRALAEAAEVARARAEAAATTLSDAKGQAQALAGQHAELEAERAQLHEQLQAALVALELADEPALLGRRLEPQRREALVALREDLRSERLRVQAAGQAVQRQLARHAQQRPEDLPDDAAVPALDVRLEALAAEGVEREQARQDAQGIVDLAQRVAAGLAAAQAELEEARGRAAVWLRLHELIGVADGKRFQLFAQALNLDQLLAQANRHLQRLNDRYRLRTCKEPDTGLPTLEFEIEDRWKPGANRSLETLSGGESFLVSLALALGLSDLRTSSMPVETLMLDEGFGTLDPRTLDVALAALQQLRATGRQVGIISHVVGLQESIEARVLVEPVGEGRSRVRACVGAR